MLNRKKEKDSRIPFIEEFETDLKYWIKIRGGWRERTFKRGDSINEIRYYLERGNIKVYV